MVIIIIMRISEITRLLSAEVIAGKDNLDTEIKSGCGSDIMGDVLAFVKDQGVLLTGLVNPQVVRAAQMMGMPCICFVRGKRPDDAMIKIADSGGTVLLACKYRMFEACGILYKNGLGACGAID